MNADPLSELRPLHLPDPVGWWPPAPLWWLLTAVALALLALGIRALLRQLRRNRYRRAALKELRAAWRAHRDDPRGCAIRAAEILRRAALARYGHARVAALHGAAWLEFLDDSARMQGFAVGPGAALARAPYDPAAGVDAAALELLCRRWLRRHR